MLYAVTLGPSTSFQGHLKAAVRTRTLVCEGLIRNRCSAGRVKISSRAGVADVITGNPVIRMLIKAAQLRLRLTSFQNGSPSYLFFSRLKGNRFLFLKVLFWQFVTVVTSFSLLNLICTKKDPNNTHQYRCSIVGCFCQLCNYRVVDVECQCNKLITIARGKKSHFHGFFQSGPGKVKFVLSCMLKHILFFAASVWMSILGVYIKSKTIKPTQSFWKSIQAAK